MKLINKTQQIYLMLVMALLVVWSGLFLWAISGAIKENIDETLHSELLALLNQSWNQDSTQVISTQQMEITPISQVDDEGVSFTDTTLFNSIEREDFPYRQVRTQVQIADQTYQITLRRSLVEYDDLFETILFMELIFIVLLIVGLFIINRNILQRLWNPFYHVLQQITDYKINSKGQVEWVQSEIDEFEQLNSVLKEMINRVESEYKKLKQFTENASHEIQTPLAVIQNQIEVLIQDESLSQDQLKSLQMINATTVKLSRLNRGLLLLTKIENDQYVGMDSLNITEILEKIIPEYQELAISKDITLMSKLMPDVTVRMNPHLTEMLFRNLLSNAVKHNHPGGTISLSLDETTFTIINTGPTLQMDTSLLFNRFQKGEQNSESLGLGLSIVQTIVDTSDLSLDYNFTDHKHTLIVNFD